MRTVYLQLRPLQSQQKVFISTSMHPALASANRIVATLVLPIVAPQRTHAPLTVRIPANQHARMSVVPSLSL